MKSSSTWLAVVLSLAALSLSPHAVAQASDADKALARDLAKEAAQALTEKRFDVAREKFARAESLYHAPTLLVGLARSYVGLGKFVEAKEAYTQVVREALPANASDAMKQAKADAESEVATLDDKIGAGTIQVTAEGGGLPSGLSVLLDDTELKQAALGLKRPMNPGAHRVVVTAPGFKSAERRFDVVAKKDVSVDLRLEKAAVAAAGATRPEVLKLTSERAPDADSATETHHSGTTGTQAILGWASVGLGGAGLLVGAIAGGLAVKRHSDLEKLCGGSTCPASAQDRIDAYNTMGTLSTVGLVAGGVFAATGVVLLVTVPSAAPAAASRAPLSIAVGPSRVEATWRF